MTVFCTFQKMVPVAELDQKRNPNNPNVHSAAQIAAIAAVLDGNGIRQSIVVSKRSGLMVRGHGRLDAAIMLGYPEFPVDYQDYDSDEAETADMIADNRLSELSEMDDNSLVKLLSEMKSVGHDIELAGFTEKEFAALTQVSIENNKDEVIPRMEIQAFEHFDYIVFLFRDIRDWLRCIQLLGVTDVNYSIVTSKKCKTVGIGRCLNGTNLLSKLDDTARNNVTELANNNDNPPGGAARDPGGAGGPGGAVSPSPDGNSGGAAGESGDQRSAKLDSKPLRRKRRHHVR